VTGGDGRDRIRHPGPPSPVRIDAHPAIVRRTTLHLSAGSELLDALGAALDAEGCDGAAVVLSGLKLARFDYVGPDRSRDGKHAAWYSQTHSDADTGLAVATATLGRKDGAWFFHCHALWGIGRDAPMAGHLLPGAVMLAEDADVDAWLLTGARMEVSPDPETNFAFFQPRTVGAGGPARLVRIAAHEDLTEAIEQVCADAGIADATLIGLGSFIGAGFEDAAPMHSPISEVVLLGGSCVTGGRARIEALCVDPEGGIFRGRLRPGFAPICVTFELLIAPE
jgi:predicted DNA-binding protein with PD1-like motif